MGAATAIALLKSIIKSFGLAHGDDSDSLDGYPVHPYFYLSGSKTIYSEIPFLKIWAKS